jgi:hypothetical protein
MGVVPPELLSPLVANTRATIGVPESSVPTNAQLGRILDELPITSNKNRFPRSFWTAASALPVAEVFDISRPGLPNAELLTTIFTCDGDVEPE